MIPEITITCSTGKVFINNITVEQYKKYAALMEKNGSDKITDALFFNKRIIQEIFGNRMSLDELGEVDVIEFLTGYCFRCVAEHCRDRANRKRDICVRRI